jgi:Domain of unknown function (DUF222)/HNH endonuclease
MARPFSMEMAENSSDVSLRGGEISAGLPSSATPSSNEDLHAELDELFRLRASIDGRIVQRLGEAVGRESFLDQGATSAETWIVERFGVAVATARAYVHVAEQAQDLPDLVATLSEGDITLDKVRAVVGVATPETDCRLCDQAKKLSVRELAEIARTTAATRRREPPALSQHDRRYLRFNDQCRTMTVQLPAESYAETRACLEARARELPSGEDDGNGTTHWDQRLCDAFTGVIREVVPGSSSPARSGSPFFVVAHVALEALVGDSGQATARAGELERDGLIDTETVQRIACDATIAIAVDDDVGHTMYEGRAQRFPTSSQRREVMRRDRHCRFPGCRNVTFTNVHHIVPWKLGGLSDLDNLALTCRFHHGVVHRSVWTMSGNANEELTFVGPSGRVMTSRPSPLWTRVADIR